MSGQWVEQVNRLHNPKRALFFARKEDHSQMEPDTIEGAKTKMVAVIIGCDRASGDNNITARIKAQ